MSSPWGKIDQVEKYSKGFSFVGTAGHGGFRISKKVLYKEAINPELITKMAGIEYGNYIYFEEDCAYNVLLLDAPQLLIAFAQKHNLDKNEVFTMSFASVKRWYPSYFPTGEGEK